MFERLKILWILILITIILIELKYSSTLEAYYPERDSQGNLWVEKGIRDAGKLIVPKGTVDMKIEEGIIFLLQGQVFTKIDIAGRKIPFERPKYVQGGTVTNEYVDSSEEVTGTPVDWKVAGENIYVLDAALQILDINKISGKCERVLPFPSEKATGIAVEGNGFYIAISPTIFCYNLDLLEQQWSWFPWDTSISGFEKLEIRNGILYTISNNQVFRIKIGKFDSKTKKVRQISIISTPLSSNKIIDLAISNNDLIITLDEKGVIWLYNNSLDPLRHFQIEGAQAVEIEGNHLFIFIPSRNEIRIFEFQGIK